MSLKYVPFTRPGPKRKFGSRRDKLDPLSPAFHAGKEGAGTEGYCGPENLAPGMYRVKIVFLCSRDGSKMGEAALSTHPGIRANDEEAEGGPFHTTRVPGTNFLPRSNEDGFDKWRFYCPKCGRDVPKSDEKIAAALALIDTPWARKVLRCRL